MRVLTGGSAYATSRGRIDAVCAEGAQQSPVDLAGAMPTGAGTWTSNGSPRRRTWWTSGTPSRSTWPRGVRSTWKAGTSRSLQFHFHRPSEHTVDGDGFPMEVHFVHQAEEGISPWSGYSWAPARAIRQSRGSGTQSRDPASRPRPSRNWIRARFCRRNRATSATPVP